MILLRGRTLLPRLCREKMEVCLHFTGIPQIDFFSSISTLLAGEDFFFKHLLKELNKYVCNFISLLSDLVQGMDRLIS